jgi:putative ABC transport system substrate-binding protein
MRRRDFIGLIGGAAAWPLTAGAQQSRKVWRIGFLSGVSATTDMSRLDRLRRGLRDLGYLEGTNFIIEPRWADNNYNRLPLLAAELVRLNVDIIVTAGTPPALAAKQATVTIPIVMAITGDPVAAGAVASLARPGGNITGQSFFGPELVAKRMQLLKEIMPQMDQVAHLTNLNNALNAGTTSRLMEIAAQSLKVAGPSCWAKME